MTKQLQICFVICLIFLLHSCTAKTKVSFTGGWTDDLSLGNGHLGGYLYVCQINKTAVVNGLYSENGIIVGTVIGSTLAGQFYEGGVGQCTTGSFSITLSTDGTSFSGFYICAKNSSVTHVWNSTRVTTQTPSEKQCALLLQSATTTATGRWIVSNTTGQLTQLDFCAGSSTYELSYKSNITLPSYGSGSVNENSLIYAGIYYTENFDGSFPGSSLWFISNSSTLYHIYWAGLGQKFFKLDDDSRFHSYTKYRYVQPTTESDCRVQVRLAAQPFDYYPVEEELHYFHYFYYHPKASSSQLVISSALLGLLLVIGMF